MRRHGVERVAGWAGMLGVVLFSASLIVLHAASTDIDWTHHYVSNFATGFLGWLFVSAALVHGLGNLALSVGLGSSLGPGRLRAWAVALFGLAAAGIVVAALFAIEPPGSSPTLAGLIHRLIVSASFPSELVALFLFSTAFARSPRWRQRSAPSFVMSAIAAVASTSFLIAFVLDWWPAAAERLALAAFLAWELWAALQLTRPATPTLEPDTAFMLPS